jgi:hypothetical protein
MERVIRAYYDACNAADEPGMRACFEPDAVHYFPAGAPQGTFFGPGAIAAGWRAAVGTLGSQWTIDSLVLDEARGETLIEWTHWKTRHGTHLRGAEVCEFGPSGLIREIRAYYACPAPDAANNYELGDFDYPGRGFPLEAPAVPGQP